MLACKRRIAGQLCNRRNSLSVAAFRAKQLCNAITIPEMQFLTVHHFLRIDRSFFCAYIHNHYERISSRLVHRFRKERKAEGKNSKLRKKNWSSNARA